MKLMTRRNSMITSIGKSRWNMSVCITVLKNSLVFLFFFFRWTQRLQKGIPYPKQHCADRNTNQHPCNRQNHSHRKMLFPQHRQSHEINGGKFKLSSIASSFSVIPLETNDSCLIGGISKLEFYDGKIFVLDKMHSARLYVFEPRENINLLLEKEGAGLMNICKLMIFPQTRKRI